MAKKKGKKLNTDLDDSSAAVIDAPEDSFIPEDEGTENDGDSMSYTMGKIEAEDSEDDEKEEFDKAAKTVTNTDSEDEDAEWVEDEDFNEKDEDSFLDEADWESDDLENDNY